MSAFLNQHVLVLNRLWQAVNVCTARRALTLLFEGHAQVVFGDNEGAFNTFDFNKWRDFSEQEPHPESVHTISFKIRVPRVILLLVFDRLPKKEVKFTRQNIFERDIHDTCGNQRFHNALGQAHDIQHRQCQRFRAESWCKSNDALSCV